MKGFLDYAPGDTFLHRLNPLSKLLLSVMICASCFLAKSHLFLFAVIGLDLALAYLGGISKRALSMLKTLLKLSVILFLLQVFFVRDGNILLRLPLNLYLTDAGISFSSLLVLRLIGATMPLALMLSITQMSDLSGVLVDKLGIPYQYAFALTTAIRFIPVFSSEMNGIIEAQTARGVAFDTKNIFKKIRLILPLCIPLLLSSVKRMEGSAISAELRGFNLRQRKSSCKSYRFTCSDAAVCCFGLGLIALGIFF